MNQQKLNKERINNKNSWELSEKSLQPSQSNTARKDKSCNSDKLQSQRQGNKEECCSTDKEYAHTTNVETISKDQLLAKINANNNIQIVNVLNPQYYGKGFIKGSKKIPLEQLNSRLNELDKTKEVVTYCAGYECSASMKAAEKLMAQGFMVKAYEGGIKEWTDAGLPTDK